MLIKCEWMSAVLNGFMATLCHARCLARGFCHLSLIWFWGHFTQGCEDGRGGGGFHD